MWTGFVQGEGDCIALAPIGSPASREAHVGAPMIDEEGQFQPRGPFMTRDGQARAQGGVPCQKKLCLVATDKAFLVRLLLEISQRPECYFVKYSAEAKDGMHLGRVFLTDERLVGELWREYKSHPKLMCSIQDDEYTAAIRRRRAAS